MKQSVNELLQLVGGRVQESVPTAARADAPKPAPLPAQTFRTNGHQSVPAKTAPRAEIRLAAEFKDF